MSEGKEAPRNEASLHYARREAVNLNRVADLAEQRGNSELAKQLRQIAQIPEGTPLHPEQSQQVKRLPVSEEQEQPSGNKAQRLDTLNVEAMLEALEQAKKLPVPPGEVVDQFYIRKARELLSKQREKQR